jgi:hypothetical protein
VSALYVIIDTHGRGSGAVVELISRLSGKAVATPDGGAATAYRHVALAAGRIPVSDTIPYRPDT